MRPLAFKYISDYIRSKSSTYQETKILDQDFLQFGIFSGYTFKEYYELLNQYKIVPNKIWGFDSWVGLPKEKEGLPIYGWTEGAFNSGEHHGSYDINIIKQKLLDMLPDNRIPIEFVDGFFIDSLTPELAMKINKPFLVDIDVDLYISTQQIHDYLYNNNLLSNGMFIYYDDWGGIQEYTGGESLAHKEFCEKYSLVFKEVASFGSFPHIQKLFQLV